MKVMPVDLGGLMKNATLKVRLTGVYRFRLRVWLAVQILRLAGLVCPFSVEIKVES